MPINVRNGKKFSRSARNVNLVVSAMRNLRDENGSTVGNIVGYISDYCDRPAPKREVVAALKRGLEFGIVDRKRGRYFLGTDDKSTEEKKRGAPKMPSDEDDGSEVALEPRRVARVKPKRARRATRAKSSARGKRVRKSAMKKVRRGRPAKPKAYKLDNFYQNPRSTASVESSLGSVDFFRKESDYSC